MNDRLKAWLVALRSGDYFQAKEQLVNAEGGYCCLGVLCKVCSEYKQDDEHFILGDECYADVVDEKTIKTLGLKTWVDKVVSGSPFEECLMYKLESKLQDILIYMNDSLGASFAEIADWIETNYEVLKCQS